jgi:hypothetical protein
MRRCKWQSHAVLALATGLLTMSTVAPACHARETDTDNPHVWQSKVKSVAVFKNGLGFFIREGDVELRDGWCSTREIPPATFGTLAIYSHEKGHTVDMIGSGKGEVVEFDGIDSPDDTDAKRERLNASKDLKIQLSYNHHRTTREAAGKLVSVGRDYAILEAADNSFAVPIREITRMKTLELPVRVHLQDEKGREPDKTTLGMAYLRKGITWIPEYTVKILDDETAELTLRGTVVNEAEDLVHCDIHFVVGVPHFLHTDYMAPIAVGQVIRTIGVAVAPRQIQSQIMNRAAIVSNTTMADQFTMMPHVSERRVPSDGGDLHGAVGNLPEMGGASASDYTVYTKKNITLRRGEKAIVTLFTKRVRYSHIYRWSPPAQLAHLLVLHNDTGTAWTTGPYLAVSGERPLSEDLLKYTPKGGRCEIPVTEAVNIAHDTSESESDRKLKAYSPHQNYYLDLVTLTGELRVHNFEKRPVDIVISATVAGRPASASEEGTCRADPTMLKLSARRGTIDWRITLEPQEKKVLTYTYEKYVPSG